MAAFFFNNYGNGANIHGADVGSDGGRWESWTRDLGSVHLNNYAGGANLVVPYDGSPACTTPRPTHGANLHYPGPSGGLQPQAFSTSPGSCPETLEYQEQPPQPPQPPQQAPAPVPAQQQVHYQNEPRQPNQQQQQQGAFPAAQPSHQQPNQPQPLHAAAHPPHHHEPAAPAPGPGLVHNPGPSPVSLPADDGHQARLDRFRDFLFDHGTAAHVTPAALGALQLRYQRKRLAGTLRPEARAAWNAVVDGVAAERFFHGDGGFWYALRVL